MTTAPRIGHQAQRHASRRDNATQLLIYHASPVAGEAVALKGLRPAGTDGRTHRADRCSCPKTTVEAALSWNRDCPPAPAQGARRAWGVLSRSQ